MVSVRKFVAASVTLAGTISAAYVNNTGNNSPLKQSAVTNVKLKDVLTNSQASYSKDNWFAFSFEIERGADDSSVSITVPDDFGSFPVGPIDLLNRDCEVVGSVTSNKNEFTAHFDDNDSVLGAFNFLGKLTASGKDKISVPGKADYLFPTSSSGIILSTIEYLERKPTEVRSSAGVDDEGRGWFMLQVPLSLYPGEMELTAKSSENFNFDPKATEVTLVTSVNDLQEPIASFPLGGVDQSAESGLIQMRIQSKISGGKYFRIKYYIKDASSTCVQAALQLKFPNTEPLKISETLCFKTGSNVQLPAQPGTSPIAPFCAGVKRSAASNTGRVNSNHTTALPTQANYTVVGPTLLPNTTLLPRSSEYSLLPNVTAIPHTAAGNNTAAPIATPCPATNATLAPAAGNATVAPAAGNATVAPTAVTKSATTPLTSAQAVNSTVEPAAPAPSPKPAQSSQSIEWYYETVYNTVTETSTEINCSFVYTGTHSTSYHNTSSTTPYYESTSEPAPYPVNTTTEAQPSSSESKSSTTPSAYVSILTTPEEDLEPTPLPTPSVSSNVVTSYESNTPSSTPTSSTEDSGNSSSDGAGMLNASASGLLIGLLAILL
ncbi:HEL192Wp [Eremothecium sinecaudum]|uniref:HEL192Wp n=1 Tax=Eremothecium sinecaudum TaxID=45286 RepID=A0A0X8HTA9_9SACH|nr:HEL192Wp [Eremothecium sinecaudum]AMD21089.1 HEL192Wp [Eremothecium sinecaudum]